MPWLAPRLPLPVPVPQVLSEDPLVVRHELVPGAPLAEPGAEHGRRLGSFLRALHDCPVHEAVRRGLPDARAATFEHAGVLDDFRARVVPLVAAGRRGAALGLLDELREPPADTVVHGDLGPEHVLVRDGVLSGVIDFGDAHTGDAAIDLAWALYGTPVAFAEALAAAYGVPGSQRERALAWHRLGPWYEVSHGLDTGDDTTVRSGLAGLVDRLDH